jgi:signal transduction histidine kinase
MPNLVVIHGVDQGRQFPLTEPSVLVGRHSQNPIQLHDNQVSRRHFELRATATGYQVHDLGSGNGTRLNGQNVQLADLNTGDRISIGETVLLYTSDEEPAQNVRLTVDGGSSQLTGILRRVPAESGSVLMTNPTQASTPWLRTRLANLAVLYEAANVVSHTLDVDELLGKIMTLVLQSSDADQGCFLLKDAETGAMMPQAVKTRHTGPTELAVSRTIVDYVLKEHTGILVSNAGDDDRFREGASIAKHRLREVICVPMRGRHETVGVLFLETQLGAEATRFTDDHLHLAIAIAHQAALAVEETRYYQALVQAERLAAVGQTIASLSHHIKNIMQGVRFGSDMVRTAMSEKDDDLLKKGWRLVERNQSKIDELILDMLSYSKQREPAYEDVDLVELVDDVLDVVRGRAKESNIALEFEKPASFPMAPCDPDGLHRALLNLVSNALDAVMDTPSARVRISLRNEHAEMIEIIVQDNGAGIPAELQSEIFKPFVSTKGSRGTGLGLPVSEKTVQEHGGELLLESDSTHGTRFTIRLPRTR